MPLDAQEALRWIEKADHDRIVARAAMEQAPPITDVAAFHCQQTVEKLLKAYLVHRGVSFEKNHDLVELLALCGQHDPRFVELRTRVEPLTPYAVRFRYPGPADPTIEAVEAALVVVDLTWRFVTERISGDAGLNE